MTGMAARLRRQGFLLEYGSMAWMTLEAAIAIAAGAAAHSIALIGFGSDSVIEFVAGALVIWERLGADQERERSATRLIGVTFFLLAGYVAAEAIRDLLTHARPDPSLPGLAITGAALIVMPALAVGKHHVGGPEQPNTAGGRRRDNLARPAFRSDDPGARNERCLRMGLGRSARRPRHRRTRCQRRAGSLRGRRRTRLIVRIST
jgi:hypothetical protein